MLEKVLSVIVSPVRTEHLSAGDLARGMVTKLLPTAQEGRRHPTPPPNRKLLVPHSLQRRLDSIFQMNIVSEIFCLI